MKSRTTPSSATDTEYQFVEESRPIDQLWKNSIAPSTRSPERQSLQGETCPGFAFTNLSVSMSPPALQFPVQFHSGRTIQALRLRHTQKAFDAEPSGRQCPLDLRLPRPSSRFPSQNVIACERPHLRFSFAFETGFQFRLSWHGPPDTLRVRKSNRLKFQWRSIT
jgi:hypothetical protein